MSARIAKNTVANQDNSSIVRIGQMHSSLKTKRQLAEYLGVSLSGVQRLLRMPKFPSVIVLGQRRFNLNKVDAWLEAQQGHT